MINSVRGILAFEGMQQDPSERSLLKMAGCNAVDRSFAWPTSCQATSQRNSFTLMKLISESVKQACKQNIVFCCFLLF